MNLVNLDITSLVLGFIVALALAILFYFGNKMFKRKAKPKAASEVKQEILKAHENLQQANKIINELYQFFNELEKIERRLDK